MMIIKSLLLIVLVISSLSLIGLILLQRSKSEGLGLAFGASTGESLFGARGGNVLSQTLPLEVEAVLPVTSEEGL
jgi:preprotein translocase subunit SecG